MISVSGVAKAFGDRTLFEDVSFQLDRGERYGLVGANGSGKTTLLNILSGDLQPDEGAVSVPSDARLGVLRQDQFLYEDETILSVALMGNRALWEAMKEKEEILSAAREDESAFDAARFGDLEEIVQRHHGYAAEAEAAKILEGLGLPGEIHDDPLSTLSGGFKLRVLLARVLAGRPDALLLDEPTNHLDILSIRWLEKFLHEFAGPVVVISHDHRFLDNVTTRILDVDYRTVTLYKGDYSHFQVKKVAERERREKEIETREKEIAHHQKFVDRFRAKASKARQAQSKLRLIEKKSEGLEELPGSSRRYPKFRFEQRRPSGKEVLRVEGIRKSFGDHGDDSGGHPIEVLHGVDLTVNRGDHMAIMGPNGIGKSTLLKILVGELEADDGTVEWGYETYPGYFAQDHHEQMEKDQQTAERWLWDFCPGRDRGFVRGTMGLMLFEGDEGEKPLAALSGGEAARLVFARLMVEKPNVLVLDEPTNHLDLESIEALVHGLREYDGTLIFVSHDRWFVKELATRIVEIDPDGVTDYHGTYEEYVHWCGDDHLDVDRVFLGTKESGGEGGKAGGKEPAPTKTQETDTPRIRSTSESSASDIESAECSPLSKNERRRLERRVEELTREIEETEARIAEIEAAFGRPDFYAEGDPERIAELQQERSALRDTVEEKMDEWARLERDLE